MSAHRFGLFEAYGIEIEHALVDRESLEVKPIADEILRAASGSEQWLDDVDMGPIGWSNELVLHVLEMKTAEPAPSFDGLASAFQESARKMDALLSARGARALGTGAHPWMDPREQTRLWPHSNAEVYAAYDRLFDCRRHGWANLESVHLNLPFGDEDEFARLLAAIRIVLPLVPALAASTPVLDGRRTEALDSRLFVYRNNSVRCPSMTGEVIPEPVFDPVAYRRQVLDPIDRELAALGADDVLLGNEWTNARGAIARFDRMAIEVRLIDAQECPRADLAVAAAVAGLIRGLVEERWSSAARQRACASAPLVELLDRSLVRGPKTTVVDTDYLALFDLSRKNVGCLGDLVRARVEASFVGSPDLEEPLAVIVSEGVLAERISQALGPEPARARLASVYRAVADCLVEGRSFRP